MSLSETCRNLQLGSGSTFIAECFTPAGEYVERSIILDSCLGNDNGEFDVYGESFSVSTFSLRLKGTVLSGTLTTTNSVQVKDSIDLEYVLVNYGGRLIAVRDLQQRLKRARIVTGTASSLITGCRDLALSKTSILTAKCIDSSSQWVDTSLDLDNWIGNSNGQLVGFSTFFSHKATDVFLRDHMLYANLQADDGAPTKATFDLSKLLVCKDGSLTPDNTRGACWMSEPFIRSQELRIAIKHLKQPWVRHDCHLCSVMCNAVRCLLPTSINSTDPDVYCKLIMGKGRLRRASLSFERDEAAAEKPSIIARYEVYVPEDAHFQIPTLSNLDRSQHLSYRVIDRAVTAAQRYLNTCQEEHEECRASQKTCLPKRVLDVGQNDMDMVKLLETKGTNEPYATLSHCWGSGVPITLTTSTMHERQAGIAWPRLPTTFQDSIILCLRLQIRYLWIDSLCIIQDSAEDWLQESAKMRAYYGQSYFCIAAAVGSDDTVGLFNPGRPSEEYILDSTGAQTGLCVRKPLAQRLNFVHSATSDESSVENDVLPLMTRAWVMQERMLSPRLIYFTEDEIVYQCRHGLVCECGEAQVAEGAQAISMQSSSPAIDDWKALAAEYSELRITYDTDRLPAFSGLAQAFQERHQAIISPLDYLAGLWRPWLLELLTWFCRGQLKPRSEQYIAPTWSWAAARSGVEIYNRLTPFSTLMTVLEASTVHRGENVMGQVTGGALGVRGPVIEVKRAVRDGDGIIHGPSHPPDDDSNVSLTESSEPLWSFCHDNFHKIHADYDFDSPGPCQLAADERLYVLPLDFCVHVVMEWLRCIILRRVDTDKYERVGYTEIEVRTSRRFCELARHAPKGELTLV